MTLHEKTKRITLAALVLVVGLAAPGRARADANVLSRDTVQFGRTFGDWAAQWWQWALSLPANKHPLFDSADCSEGQSGPVWFLGGKFCPVNDTGCDASVVQRSCTVPSTKALFFPIANVDDSLIEDPASETIAQMRIAVEQIIDIVNVSASIDGVPVQNLKARFREQSPVFSFTLPAGDLFSALGEGPFSPGTYSPAVDEGVYLMVPPLKPGKHVIRFHGDFFPSFNFGFDVTYDLTVSAR